MQRQSREGAGEWAGSVCHKRAVSHLKRRGFHHQFTLLFSSCNMIMSTSMSQPMKDVQLSGFSRIDPLILLLSMRMPSRVLQRHVACL